MLTKTAPINDWFTTVIQPIVSSNLEGLHRDGFLPRINKDFIFYAPVQLELEDVDTKDVDKAILPAQDVIQVAYSVEEQNTHGIGLNPIRDGLFKIISDDQGNVHVYAKNKQYLIETTYTYITESKIAATELASNINSKIKSGKYMTSYPIKYNYNIPPRILDILDLALQNRVDYDDEVNKLEIAEVIAKNNLPPTDPNYSPIKAHVPEVLRPLSMSEYLSTISVPNLYSRFDNDLTYRQPMVVMNSRDVLGYVTTGMTTVTAINSTQYSVEIIHKVTLDLPRELHAVYSIIIYNRMVSEDMLRPLEDKPDYFREVADDYVRAITINQQPNVMVQELREHIVNREPEFDIYPITSPKGYEPIHSSLVNIDLSDRQALLNINSDTEALIDLQVKGWLQRGEYERCTTLYNSGIYIGLSINEKLTFDMLTIDEDFNVRSVIPLSPKNTYRVVIFILSDPRVVNGNVIRNMWKCPYMWLMFIDIWYFYRNISSLFRQYLINITPKDLTGEWETDTTLLRTLLGGRNPLEEVKRLEKAGPSSRYNNGTINPWEDQYGNPFDIKNLPSGGMWINVLRLGGCSKDTCSSKDK